MVWYEIVSDHIIHKKNPDPDNYFLCMLLSLYSDG